MKVKGYTPLWLSQQPGRAIFAPSAGDPAPSLSSSTTYASSSAAASSFSPRRSSTTGRGGSGSNTANAAAPGPRRTIARRGTEIFVAVGREIRWADLLQLRETWSASSRRQSVHNGGIKREDSEAAEELLASNEPGSSSSVGAFRTIKAPVADEIRQLVVSPFADFLAVLTAHTCHILILPDSSHLSSSTTAANSVLRPKFFTLGSSVHVTTRSPIVSALWHPLGVNGSCLVTVTEDSIVRTWELAPQNRYSFERCTQAVDLRKLVDGSYLEQDFSASSNVMAGAKVFSPDSVEMRAASACFPSRGTGRWCPMTLWIAMREGDIYALCPLLPERWAPPPTLVPSLSVAIVANLAAVEDDDEMDPARRRLAQQQFDWMSDLDSQDPQVLPSHPGEPPTEVYARPQRPGAVPRLQGPFSIPLARESENDLDNRISDIFVIGQKSDTEELMDGEEMDLVADGDREGLSLSVVCLLSTSGQVRICLDVNGVEAEWLPSRKPKFYSTSPQVYDVPSLLAFQALDVLTESEAYPEGHPVFSEDVSSRYSFYVTHGTSITYVSLASWVTLLEREIQNQSSVGVDFRLDLLAKGHHHERERLYTRENHVDGYTPLAACQVIRDADLGYMLLSATPYEPVAITLEAPEEAFELPHHMESPEPEEEYDVGQPQSFVFEPRQVFEPPHVLNLRSALPDLIERLRTSRHKTTIHTEVKLSPATLSTFTDAHQILAEETHKLGIVAAELFRRSDQLCGELRNQVEKVAALRDRISAIAGTEHDGIGNDENGEGVEEGGVLAPARLAARVAKAQDRQKRLLQRLDALKQRTGRTAGATRELSVQEAAWTAECCLLERSVLGGEPVEGKVSSTAKKPHQRLADVKNLTAELVAEARALTAGQEADGRMSSASTRAADDRQSMASSVHAVAAPLDLKIPSALRRRKVEEIRMLLDREATMVNAVVERLGKLTTAG